MHLCCTKIHICFFLYLNNMWPRKGQKTENNLMKPDTLYQNQRFSPVRSSAGCCVLWPLSQCSMQYCAPWETVSHGLISLMVLCPPPHPWLTSDCPSLMYWEGGRGSRISWAEFPHGIVSPYQTMINQRLYEPYVLE